MSWLMVSQTRKGMRDMAKVETEEPEIPSIEKRNFSQSLKCRLTADEVAEQAQVMAEKIDEKAAIESEFDSVKNQFRGRISGIETEIENAKNLVRDKFKYRQTDCIAEKNFDTGQLTVYRTDTGETVESRKMRADEMQRRLALEPAQ